MRSNFTAVGCPSPGVRAFSRPDLQRPPKQKIRRSNPGTRLDQLPPLLFRPRQDPGQERSAGSFPGARMRLAKPTAIAASRASKCGWVAMSLPISASVSKHSPARKPQTSASSPLQCRRKAGMLLEEEGELFQLAGLHGCLAFHRDLHWLRSSILGGAASLCAASGWVSPLTGGGFLSPSGSTSPESAGP